MAEKEEEETFLGFLAQTFFVLFPIICLIKWIWPTSIPLNIFQFWTFDKFTILAGWPIFVWGIFAQSLSCSFRSYKHHEIINAEEDWAKNMVASLMAGVFEELTFRWVLFYSAFIGVLVSNFLFLGFISSELEFPRILAEYIFNPLANLATFESYDFLVYKGWWFGASVLAANAKFRNGHKYQGLLGLINSWYIGLFLFDIMFKYGIVSAIVIHFLYDVIVFTIVYIHTVFHRSAKPFRRS